MKLDDGSSHREVTAAASNGVSAEVPQNLKRDARWTDEQCVDPEKCGRSLGAYNSKSGKWGTGDDSETRGCSKNYKATRLENGVKGTLTAHAEKFLSSTLTCSIVVRLPKSRTSYRATTSSAMSNAARRERVIRQNAYDVKESPINKYVNNSHAFTSQVFNEIAYTCPIDRLTILKRDRKKSRKLAKTSARTSWLKFPITVSLIMQLF